MATSTLYFAYGSNLNLRQFALRCPGHVVVGRGVVHGYRLAFPRYARDWNSAVAGIVPAAGHHVEGAVYRITDAHIAALDVYEGVAGHHYTRGSACVTLPDGRVIDAMTYFANPQDCPAPPSPRYLRAILEGARDHGLSPAWHAMLEGMLNAGLGPTVS